MASPGEIAILIHYYITPEPYSQRDLEHAESPFVKDKTNLFFRMGLLNYLTEPNKYGSHYEANLEALAVYINALCKVPYPVQKWIIPEEES